MDLSGFCPVHDRLPKITPVSTARVEYGPHGPCWRAAITAHEHGPCVGGARKMADLKLADLKMTDQIVRKMGEMKLAELKMADQKWRMVRDIKLADLKMADQKTTVVWEDSGNTH